MGVRFLRAAIAASKNSPETWFLPKRIFFSEPWGCTPGPDKYAKGEKKNKPSLGKGRGGFPPLWMGGKHHFLFSL